MIRQIKTVVSTHRDTLLQDAMGVVSLIVLLVAALHLPALV
ncbi:hypothetical protein [Pseudodonghicola xiamenensis]|nr:hypothetical protein [Pseudodonghicola xiamenensis]